MRVIRADVLGMCFGVRDALAMIDGIGEPRRSPSTASSCTTRSSSRRLESRGFEIEDEAQRRRLVARDAVGLDHGARDQRPGAATAGVRRQAIVDTTCPLVTRVHQAARRLEADGYHVLVIGRRGHVEVEGIIEDLDHFDVIESADEVRSYPRRSTGNRLPDDGHGTSVASIRGAIAAQNPDAEIRFIDTVCLPTKEHQRALERLLERVDAVVVVGGRNSNNTRRAGCSVPRGRQAGLPRAVGRRPRSDWFKDFATVGLTAGTSTLAETIDEVHRAFASF